MQFAFVAVCSILLVSGIRSEAEPISGSTIYKEGHHDYLQALHHGQHHPPGSPEGVSQSSHPVGISQEQNSVVPQDQVSHPSLGQIGQVGPVGQVGHVLPPYVTQKSADIPLHYAARAIASPYPYLYGKAYASPYYAPYQPAVGPYGGYYPQAYPYHHYSPNPYSANPYSVTPYSAPGYQGPVVGYSGYQGAGNYGYVPPYYPSGYSQYYQPSAEVQQSSSKQ